MEGEITMESMKYSNTVFPVPLDPRQIVSEVHANAVNLPQRTVREHIEYALDHPIGAGPIEEAVRPGEKICILISDVTRRWQQPSEYLPVLIERLNRAGIPDEDILILCATGTHRQQTKEEHISLVGEEIYRRIRLIDHQCDDREHLTYMGTSSRGTPVWLNSYAMACDKLILTGGVVYHFLAGFGGGRKSIVPGIAGRETINTNHNNALNEGLGSGSNPRACNGNMGQDNPFHSDLVECAAFAKPAYLLNVIVNDDYQIVGAFAGDWQQAHAAAARVVEQLDGVAIPRRTPLVIASAGGYPKDINLYQTSKTLANALAAVAPGGTMILLSQCGEGFGDPDCEAQICGYDSMEEREKALRADFSIGGFVGFLFAETAEHYHLILVTDIPGEKFARTGIQVARTLNEALALAAQHSGGSLEGVETTLMPHGGSTFPLPQA